MCRFVWLDNDTRININNIYEIGKRYVASNKEAIEQYDEKYNTLKNYYIDNMPELEINVGNGPEMYTPRNDDNFENNIRFEAYFKTIANTIVDLLGARPEEYIQKCVVITLTGTKIYIDDNKYEQLNNLIDKINDTGQNME